jgi:hypothetical protein
MRTKWLFVLLPLFAFQNLHSQELSEEDFDMMSASVYEVCTSFFQPKNYLYKEGRFKKEDFFEPVLNAKQADKLIQLLKQSAKLSIEVEESASPQLVFSVEYRKRDYKLFEKVDDLDLVAYHLKNEDGQALELNGYFSTEGSFKYYKLKAGIEENSYQASSTLSGSATYNIRILTGYDEIKLSKKDIGKTFELNNCPIKLVDILHNQVILDPMCEDEISVNLINFSKENTVYEPYDYMTLMEMQEKDSTINTYGSFSQSSRTIDKKMFNIVQKDPDLSLEEFRKSLTKEDIVRMEKYEDHYLIVMNVAPISDQFVLFAPKFKEEEVKVQF